MFFHSHFLLVSAEVNLGDASITERVAIVDAIKSGELLFAMERLTLFKPEVHFNSIRILSCHHDYGL